MTSRTMDITLLDRSYRVNCPVGQESALQEAADALNERLNDTKERTNLHNVEQIAVMTALNLCHEWMNDQKSKPRKRRSLKKRFNCCRQRLNKP